MRYLVVLFVLCLAAMLASGCNRAANEPPRGALSGQVTLNGKPVAKGTIRFMAIDPSGVNVLATITAGQYAVPAGAGPTKGKYVVQFSVPSETKQRVPNDDVPGQYMEVAVETLPARYHQGSTITLEYDPAQPQPQDYRLTTP